MTVLLLTALTLLTPAAEASAREYHCEESALAYIVQIANAPYKDYGPSFPAEDLVITARRSAGDGAYVTESFTVRFKDGTGNFRLQLAVEEIGGACPLLSYKM